MLWGSCTLAFALPLSEAVLGPSALGAEEVSPADSVHMSLGLGAAEGPAQLLRLGCTPHCCGAWSEGSCAIVSL